MDPMGMSFQPAMLPKSLPVIPPEVNGVLGMFLGSKYLLTRCLEA